MKIKLFDSELKVMEVLWRRRFNCRATCLYFERRNRVEQEHNLYCY